MGLLPTNPTCRACWEIATEFWARPGLARTAQDIIGLEVAMHQPGVMRGQQPRTGVEVNKQEILPRPAGLLLPVTYFLYK